jgi:hypothetical protein
MFVAVRGKATVTVFNLICDRFSEIWMLIALFILPQVTGAELCSPKLIYMSRLIYV